MQRPVAELVHIQQNNCNKIYLNGIFSLKTKSALSFCKECISMEQSGTNSVQYFSKRYIYMLYVRPNHTTKEIPQAVNKTNTITFSFFLQNRGYYAHIPHKCGYTITYTFTQWCLTTGSYLSPKYLSETTYMQMYCTALLGMLLLGGISHLLEPANIRDCSLTSMCNRK